MIYVVNYIRLGLLRDALKKEKEWVNNVPGFNGYKLRDASRLSELPLSVMELKLAMESYGILNENSSMPVIRSKTLMDPVLQSLSRLSEEREYISQFERAAELNMSTVNNLVSFNQVPESSLTNKTVSRDSTGPVIYRRDSVWKQHKGNTSDKKDKASNEETGLPEILVIIRHGKTEYNKLGIFTGN